MVFDSVFDGYRGVVSYIRVMSGSVIPGTAVKLMSTNKSYEIKEVGVFTPKMFQQKQLNAGDVGYFIANIKTTAEIKIGDTLTDSRRPASEPLPGSRRSIPWCIAAFIPSTPPTSST